MRPKVICVFCRKEGAAVEMVIRRTTDADRLRFAPYPLGALICAHHECIAAENRPKVKGGRKLIPPPPPKQIPDAPALSIEDFLKRLMPK